MAFFDRAAITLTILSAALAITSTAQAQATTTTTELPAWLNKISIGGDFRFRALRETDGRQGENTKGRLRGRLLITAKPNDTWSAAFRLTSGRLESGQIRSTNVDFDEYGKRKEVSYDLAYLGWNLMEGVALQVGKVPNNFWAAGKNEMVFSGGVTWDGFNAKFQPDLGGIKPMVNLTYAVIDELGYTASADTTFIGAQIGTSFNLEPLIGGIALNSFTFNNVANTPGTNTNSPNNVPIGSRGSIFGNTLNGTNFAYDYKMLGGGIELGMDLGLGPIVAYAEYAKNSEVSSNDQANIAGVRWGVLKAPSSWFASYSYRDVAKDAVLGTFSDSTYLGGAGADLYGHQVQLGYQLAENVGLGATYNFGRVGDSTANQLFNREDYILDLIAAF